MCVITTHVRMEERASITELAIILASVCQRSLIWQHVVALSTRMVFSVYLSSSAYFSDSQIYLSSASNDTQQVVFSLLKILDCLLDILFVNDSWPMLLHIFCV